MKRVAFSIIEVMFAIMIMGIGFIMVAAIFPVGIQQGRDAVDETTGQTIARQAASRAGMALLMISQDPDIAKRNQNLTAIAALCTNNTQYQWVDPSNTSQTITMGTPTITNGSYSGQIGGGKVYLQQQMGAEYQYMGTNDYVTQVFYKTAFNGTDVGTMDVLALAFRDGRDQAYQGTPLGSPHVTTYQVAFDSKANIYSDLYIRNSDGSAADPTQVQTFLGTRGSIATVGGKLIRMSDGYTLQYGAPPTGVTLTWQNAWAFRNDVPLLGSFHLMASLP